MGYLRTLPANGGGGVSAPHSTCQTAGPILDPKTLLDSFWLVLSEYIAKLHLHVIDDVTFRAKAQIFTVIAGFAGENSRIRLSQSRLNGMDRAGDNSKYRPKHSVALCQLKVI